MYYSAFKVTVFAVGTMLLPPGLTYITIGSELSDREYPLEG